MSEDNDMKQFTETAKALNLGGLLPELYADSLKPAAQEIGKGLGTVAKTINVALSPLSGLVWGYEKLEEYVKVRLEEKFKDSLTENIIPPPPNVAVPLLESLRYTAFQEELREMYINLLSTSMDRERTEKAHPSFVEILKQLSPDEAKLLSFIPNLPRFPDICSVRVHSSWAWGQKIYTEVEKEFLLICKDAKINYPELSPSYLDNLRRLLILEFRQEVSGKVIDTRQRQQEIETDYVEIISVTAFGEQFISACITN